MIDDGTRMCLDCRGQTFRGEPHHCKYPGLRAALEQRGVTVTETDDKMLRWMAMWDRSTCDWFVSVVTRAASAGGAAALAELAALAQGDGQ